MRIVVGLSGGVDSSVAAYLLKAQGHDVLGLFMRNWHDTTGTLSGDCPWEDDRVFAELVAKKLDIEFHYIDLSQEYRTRVVDYMFDEYAKGRTPNPDVLCNREIKFDAFMKSALKLGADYVATGHYCRKGDNNELLAGVDKNKDQSYFLCQLSEQQLSKALFPIGELQKSEVRRIAMEQGLATAERKDSQGICFVGKVDLPVFLQQKLAAKRGDIIEIMANSDVYTKKKPFFEPWLYCPSDGVKVGQHNGAHYYTVGQRHGLGVGGKKEPLFVIATDTENNTIYVGMGENHPGLYREGLFINHDELHWICDKNRFEQGQQEFDMRIRYRQPLQKGILRIEAEGGYITFDKPQRGVTAGQFACWYRGQELCGSGVIER
ncbi:MAG: tRNA 2-thiouridine(34) synthase MnmA [Mucinivorans sp.]